MVTSSAYRFLILALAVMVLGSSMAIFIYSFNCEGENVHLISFRPIEHNCKANQKSSCHEASKDDCNKDCCSQDVAFQNNDQVINNVIAFDSCLIVDLIPSPFDIECRSLTNRISSPKIRPPPNISSSGRSVVIKLQQFLC